MSDQEEWRPCLFGNYEVSNHGNVRRLAPGRRTWPGRPLKPYLMKIGYWAINPVIDGKNKLYTIHSLVAEAFLGPRPECMEVNHIDGVKTNNHISNLEYVTHKENLNHARRIGLTTDDAVTIYPESLVDAVRLDRLAGMSFKKIADKHGIGITTVYNYCCGDCRGKSDIVGERQKPKLTPELVVALRNDRASGETCIVLAERYGISETTVSNICIGRKWKHVGGPLTRTK